LLPAGPTGLGADSEGQKTKKQRKDSYDQQLTAEKLFHELSLPYCAV
jgi:hypothetical protein